MKIFFDTSALAAAMVEAHPAHRRSLSWLERAYQKENALLAAAHGIADLYSILTALPVSPRIAPSVAWRMIQANVLERAQLAALSAGAYRSVVGKTADLGLSGRAVWNALTAAAAQTAGADRLVTLNPADFERIWPEGADVLCVP